MLLPSDWEQSCFPHVSKILVFLSAGVMSTDDLLLDGPVSTSNPTSAPGEAWRSEFWPPLCAEAVLALAGALVVRGGYIHNPARKYEFLQAIPHEVLKVRASRVIHERVIWTHCTPYSHKFSVMTDYPLMNDAVVWCCATYG